MKSFFCTILALSSGTSYASVDRKQTGNDSLRGSIHNIINYERSLENQNRKTSSSNNSNSNNNNSNNQGGNYRNNNSRNYMNYYWYPRYYYGGGYYAHRSYANQQQAYYDDIAGDDGAANDDAAAYNATESNGDDMFASVTADIEEKFWQWYQSPPSDWTAGQWAWFSGILVSSVLFMCCCCVGCASLCAQGKDKACNPTEIDDYTSIGGTSNQRGSFMTLNTKRSGASSPGGSSTAETIVDDDATYDTILRMRSSS